MDCLVQEAIKIGYFQTTNMLSVSFIHLTQLIT
jgi:hypothetical protein